MLLYCKRRRRPVYLKTAESDMMRCIVYLLVSMDCEKVVGCWVDGYCSGAGAINWNCAMKLQTHKDEGVSVGPLAKIGQKVSRFSKSPLACEDCRCGSHSLC